MGDDNSNDCGSGYGGSDSGCGGYGGDDSNGGYGGGESDSGYGGDDSCDSYGGGDSDGGYSDSAGDYADSYSSDDSYSSSDDGDSYGWGSAYSDYSNDSYTSDDAVADAMDFSEADYGWGAVANEAGNALSDFCDEVTAMGESAYDGFTSTVESAIDTVADTVSSFMEGFSHTDIQEETDIETVTDTPEQSSSYMDLYDPEGYLDEPSNPDNDISPDSKGIMAMAAEAITDGIAQRQQEITEELPDYVNAVNDASNNSSYLSDLGDPEENSYTPAPDDVSTGSPGIVSMAMAAVADHYNHPPQELIDAAEELKEKADNGELSPYTEDEPAEEAPVNPDDEIAPNGKGFISTVGEALALGAEAMVNHINNPSQDLQQAAQEMKDRTDKGELSAYADDEYSHEQEENYASYEVGRRNAEERFQNLRDISNVWEKNTFTNVADTAISSQHIFTSETVTPFAKANINTVAEGAVYGLKSAKTVAKSSVVGLTFAAADTYGDLTNENFTSVQKKEAVVIDLVGVVLGLAVGVGFATVAAPAGATLIGCILAGVAIDKSTDFAKGKLGLK